MQSVRSLITNSTLLPTLYGVRSVFERELDIDNISFLTDEAAKQQLARKDQRTYPYYWMNFSELRAVKDQGNARNMARMGLPLRAESATEGTVGKTFLFPVDLALEFHYVNSDPLDLLQMSGALCIMSEVNLLNFQLELFPGMDYEVRVEIPDSVSIPVRMLEDEAGPAGGDLTLQFVVHTYIGFISDVPRFRAGRPTITTTLAHTKGL